MPGMYPEYPDTQKGVRRYNFIMNGRSAGLLSPFVGIILGAVLEKYIPLPMVIVTAGLAICISIYVIFKYNIGGRLMTMVDPMAPKIKNQE